MPRVKWGEKEIEICWSFTYLGSNIWPDGNHKAEVKIHIAQAKFAGKNEIRPRLDTKTRKMLNGTNAQMLS